MADACDLLGVELALDRIDAELARELPAHLRAFARAYAVDAGAPPAPAILRRPATLAAVLTACTHPALADRGLALLRLIAPILVEDTPRVAVARSATPSWPAYAVLRAARDAATLDRFGVGSIALCHLLHGSASPGTGSVSESVDTRVADWTGPDGALHPGDIRAAWDAIATLHGVHGAVEIRATPSRPRAFVIEPGREIIVVIPNVVDTPARRFAVLHELGHALAALALPHPFARVVDEAAGSYVARLMETNGILDARWYSPLARAARARRLTIATQLDAIERGRAEGSLIAARPPWALWHDPGAQAAYVEAEAMADRFVDPADFAHCLARENAAIDQRSTLPPR